jgi:hypothetical protein
MRLPIWLTARGRIDELIDRGGRDEPLAANADAVEPHALAAFQAPTP